MASRSQAALSRLGINAIATANSQSRENASISVTAATAPASMPSIAARQTSFRDRQLAEPPVDRL
jgi:hypothetical protein